MHLGEIVHDVVHRRGKEGESMIDPEGQRLQARCEVGVDFEPVKVGQASGV